MGSLREPALRALHLRSTTTLKGAGSPYRLARTNLTPACSPKFRLLRRRTTMPLSAPGHKAGRDGTGRSDGGRALMGLRKHQFEWAPGSGKTGPLSGAREVKSPGRHDPPIPADNPSLPYGHYSPSINESMTGNSGRCRAYSSSRRKAAAAAKQAASLLNANKVATTPEASTERRARLPFGEMTSTSF